MAVDVFQVFPHEKKYLDLVLIEQWLTDSNLRHGHVFGDGTSTLAAWEQGSAQLWLLKDEDSRNLAAFATTILESRYGRFLTFLGFGGHSGLGGQRIKAAFVEVEKFAKDNQATIEMIAHPAFKRILGNLMARAL